MEEGKITFQDWQDRLPDIGHMYRSVMAATNGCDLDCAAIRT